MLPKESGRLGAMRVQEKLGLCHTGLCSDSTDFVRSRLGVGAGNGVSLLENMNLESTR